MAWKKKLFWIKIHYAIKSNPHDFIIRDLNSWGTGFDAAS